MPAAGRGDSIELALNAVEQLVVGVAERLHALALQYEGHCVEIAPGAVRTLHLKLAPGRYIFFCNMAGHYLGGMHHEVVVQ